MSPRHITMKTPKNRQPEWDSDVNDDPGREMLLDRSFADWTTSLIQEQTEREKALTQVPEGSVFEAAEDLEE